MSKAKINSVSYDELRTHVQSAADALTEVDTIWGDMFEDLYYAFIDSGYLNDLYEDAKSNYYTLKKTVSAIGNVVSGALLGCAVGGAPGAIIGAVIGAIFGIWEFCTTDPTWITTSKEVFEQLLTDCVNGNNDCYIGITNIGTKLLNVQVSLEEIRTKINEFNYTYASLEESMNELGLKGTMTDDGVLLSVDTEVTINGQTVSTSVSEALNAFYTYQNTVMGSRIEAQILADTYGIEIDYDAIVANANGFMVNTLNSGLYSHTFVQAIAPSYSPDMAGATEVVAGGLGITSNDYQSALGAAAGVVGMGAGLLGGSFIGQLNIPEEEPPADDQTTPPASDDQGPKPGENDGDNGGGPSTSTPGGTSPGGSSGGGPSGGGPSYSDETTSGPSESTPDKDKEDTSKDDTPTNDVEVDKPVENEIPDKLESAIEKDYDDLARREFESLDPEEITARRQEIMEGIDEAYANGDFSDIKAKLKEWGYSEPEINALIADRDKLSIAMISGDQKEMMAEIAADLAKADGIDNYESSYTKSAEWNELTDGSANALVVNMSGDKEVSKALDNMMDAEEDYGEALAEATVAVEAVALAKTTMNDLSDKFTKEFGSSDPNKWSKEAAEEYKDAVKDYNDKVKDAQDKMKKHDEAKEEYDEAKEEYEEAKVDFMDRVKEEVANDQPTYDDNGQGDTGYVNDGQDYVNGGGNRVTGSAADMPGVVETTQTVGNNQGIDFTGIDQANPGIAMATPEDNSLYAAENYGADGVYREDVTVTYEDGSTEVVTNTSEGASFATGSGAPSAVGTSGVAQTTVVQSGTNSEGVATNTVTISDAELLAALNIASEEAKNNK